jgi:hypothetical protein
MPVTARLLRPLILPAVICAEFQQRFELAGTIQADDGFKRIFVGPGLARRDQ